MSEGFILRVSYKIAGRLAYLSHLETIRSVERIVRRAQLPFAVTEGFSPHMKIAFGPALPVGAGSEGEYFDVRLTQYLAAQSALERLQASAPPHLMPLDCRYISSQDDSISVAFPVSDWHAVFAVDDAAGASALQAAFDQLVARGFIEVEKKKGRKAKVKRVEFEGRLVKAPEVSWAAGHADVRFSTLQTEAGALRPDKFMQEALAACSDAPQLISLVREQLRGA